jgi:hypothetical protein
MHKNAIKSQKDRALRSKESTLANIKTTVKDYLDVKRYKAIKTKLDEMRLKNQGPSGSGAVMVRRLMDDPFSKENEKKPRVRLEFLTQVFAVTEHTTIEDIYNESLRFFEIDQDNAQAGSEDEEKEIETEKFPRKADKKKTVGFAEADETDKKEEEIHNPAKNDSR